MRKKRFIAKKGYVKGSFTVEASLIVPVILFTLVGGINIGYDMFREARNISEIREELKELDPVKDASTVKLPFTYPFFAMKRFLRIRYQIVQGEKCRKWTGYQLGQDAEENDTWLYYTEYGTVYHASRSCTHLDLSIRGVTSAQADGSRNSSGGRYHACEKCGGSSFGMVYITNYGDRYHSSLTCSGLKRSIYMIRKSKALGKRMCAKCGG